MAAYRQQSVNSGTPQGSRLGSLSFLIYTIKLHIDEYILLLFNTLVAHVKQIDNY